MTVGTRVAGSGLNLYDRIYDQLETMRSFPQNGWELIFLSEWGDDRPATPGDFDVKPVEGK